MSSHTNTAILKAYADNTDLVIFIRDLNSKWIRTDPKALMDYPDDEFFACLLQHEKPCFHWLNGGDIEFQMTPDWFAYPREYSERYVWSLSILFMDKTYFLRIKPRKEKRWICITDNLEIEDVTIYESYADADENSPGYKQIVEIEVEV